MFRTTLIACALLSLVGTASAQTATNPVPDGFVDCNHRNVPGCEAGVPLPVVAETPEVMADIEKVNADINAAVTPMEDQPHYNHSDWWAQPKDGFGDCEDYALAKKVALAKLGIPSRLADLEVIGQFAGGTTYTWHVVLLVVTDRETYVLDSVAKHANEIRSYDEAADDDYAFLSAQDEHGNWAFSPPGKLLRIVVAQN